MDKVSREGYNRDHRTAIIIGSIHSGHGTTIRVSSDQFRSQGSHGNTIGLKPMICLVQVG